MEFKLKATDREMAGTAVSRQLRRNGQLPGIVYGNNEPTVKVSLDHKEVYLALKNEAFHSSVITLIVGGKEQSVVVRDFQMHPFKQAVQHIDFQRIDLKKTMQLKIALHFIHEDISPAVKLQGFRVTHLLNEVEVRALPAKMPTFIEVDLSAINAGDTVRLSDLKMPEGAELVDLLRGDNAIVAATTSKTGSAEEETESTATEVEAEKREEGTSEKTE